MIDRVLVQQAFLKIIIPMAVKSERLSQVPAEVTVGQAIIESHWGQSKLTQLAKNLFGIKAENGWTGKRIRLAGYEIIKGKTIRELMDWRYYDDYQQSVDDHSAFLHKPRYAAAFKATTWHDFLEEIWKAGYATDPQYVPTVTEVLTPAILGAIADARDSTAPGVRTTQSFWGRFVSRFKA